MVLTVIDYLVIAPEDLVISSKEVAYATSSSYVNPATLAASAWSTSYPASLPEGTWLHTRTTLVYSDGNSTVTYMSSYVGRNGTSPIFADITNEHGGVVCDSSGNTTGGEQSVSTKALMYLGNTLQTLTSIVCKVEGTTLGTAYTDNADPTRCFRAVSYPSTGTITVYVRNGSYLKTEDVIITVSANINGSTVSKDLRLSLSGSWAGSDGAPAVLYELEPSVDVVSRDSDSIPLYDSISFKVKKSVGGTISEVSNWSTEGLTLYHNVGGSDVSDGTVSGATKTISGIQNGLYAENDKVEWILKKGTTVVDREGIGSVDNGEQGDPGDPGDPGKDSILATITRNVGVVPCNSSGNTTSAQSVDAYVAIEKGGVAQTITGIACKIDDNYELGDNYASDGTPAPTVNFKKSTTLSSGYVKIFIKSGTSLVSPVVIVITVSATIDGVSVSRKVTLTIEGKQPGEKGDGGEVYSIMSELGGITIGSNTTSGSFTATVRFYKKVGSAARAAYSCYCSVFRRKGASYYHIAYNGNSKATSWYVEGLTVNSGSYDALVFCIYDTKSSSHSGYLAELEIPIYKHGDTGPTYWPSGNYDEDATYTKTSQKTPLVFMEDKSMTVWNEYAQAYGDYWYLTADTNVVNGVHYKPEDGSSCWAKAENYGVLMVGAQFARFAKNGAGIMAGDYYYSANGRINGVERVDGQGADGNAVSASNPPAYTRFMGDPLIQNGYFNRTNLSGPVNGDKLLLQTIQLTRGVTLNISIQGRTTNDTTKYGYFYAYRINADGSKTQMAYGWIYKTMRTISLSFTASVTGEYTIEYYGQDAATVATFYGFWELSGHFYPNWWVDLKTGKMCGAKDNFVIGSDGIRVNGAMMTHKVKLQTKLSKYITFPDHAAYEDDYWDSNGDVYLYEAEDNGLPVRIYSDPDAIYYGLRSCKLKYDQVYVGVVAETGKRGRVVIYLPPPHLFIGQRITITNNTMNFPSGSDVSGVFLQMDYMLYTRTDYSEGICLTGQDAYFEDDGTGDQDGNGKNGKPYICNVPERGGAGAIPACGIWMGEVSESQLQFFTALVDEMNIEDYEWIELTSMRGYYAEKYEGTAQWESTMNYNAYWMLTRWKKKDE